MRIKQILKKKKTYDLYSEIATHCSIPLVKLAMFLKLTPNMVSGLGILSVLFAAFQFSLGNNLWAVFFLYFGLVCDFADGILARCTRKVTKYQSVYLERIYHELAYAFIFIGIGYNMGIFGLFLGFICTISILCTSYLFHLKNWILSSFAGQNVKEDNFNDVGINEADKRIMNKVIIPSKYIKSILLFTSIINLIFSINPFPILLILYTFYFLIRVPAYALLNYITLGGFERAK